MAPSDRAIRAARFRVKVILATMLVIAEGLAVWSRDWRGAAVVGCIGLALLVYYRLRSRRDA